MHFWIIFGGKSIQQPLSLESHFLLAPAPRNADLLSH